jgi:tetratricopeptide (TPR) repeat protein
LGPARVPQDGGIAFLEGTVTELLASPILAGLTTSRNEDRARRFALRRMLKEAEARYRRALRLAPDMASARLHLGRVLDQLGEEAASRVELERVLASTQDNDTLFYAAMFLGQIHARAGRLHEAQAAYERAAAIRPFAQSTIVALAHVHNRAGDRLTARDLLARLMLRPGYVADCGLGCSQQPDAGSDPWRHYYLPSHARLESRLQALLQRSSP